MSDLSAIKKEFMALRNGIISDSLRKAIGSCPYHVIFGLMVPQISEIASRLPHTMELADALWADAKVRESRILACYLFPLQEVTEGKASELMESLQTTEEADMLTFRLLRNLDFASQLAARYESHPEPLLSYTAAILSRHLASMGSCR